MRVTVEVDHIELEGDHGGEIPSLELTCSRCGHSVQVYGESEASEKRGCVMLHEQCPNGENNFYVPE